jgi:hypothetical protein
MTGSSSRGSGPPRSVSVHVELLLALMSSGEKRYYPATVGGSPVPKAISSNGIGSDIGGHPGRMIAPLNPAMSQFPSPRRITQTLRMDSPYQDSIPSLRHRSPSR